MDSEPKTHGKEETNDRTSIRENGVTIKQSENKKSPGKLNVKLSVFREFALATAHVYAREHGEKQSAAAAKDEEDGRRPFFACDLVAQSGIAGIQWKRHIGDSIHVTVAEQREPLLLQSNIKGNGFTVCTLPVNPKRPAGNLLPNQSSSEIHVAECDPAVLLLLEAFDFVYVDPHKNPAPFFGTLFRNIRNNGVVCIVVPDTMQFARSPHVVRRCYGANCIKTEYLKELAVRIILAALASEAAKCHKGLTVLYTLSMEDFLLLCVRVVRGPKVADAMLTNIGYVLHCRICEERAVYPGIMAPVEDPYSMLGCDCQKNIPGKTGVILGPLWKGSIYDFPCLTKVAASGKTLRLTSAFFTLLQRAMEDCLCDTPPSLHSLKQGLCDASTQNTISANADLEKNSARKDGSQQKLDVVSVTDSSESTQNINGCVPDSDCQSTSPMVSDKVNSCGDTRSASTNVTGSSRVKRSASDAEADKSPAKRKRLKSDCEPAPCFFYNVHSKRLGKDHLPKQLAIMERLRARGYRCCRTHFEKYAIRTSANLKTLTALLGSGESRVLYVKGNQEDA